MTTKTLIEFQGKRIPVDCFHESAFFAVTPWVCPDNKIRTGFYMMTHKPTGAFIFPVKGLRVAKRVCNLLSATNLMDWESGSKEYFQELPSRVPKEIVEWMRQWREACDLLP